MAAVIRRAPAALAVALTAALCLSACGGGGGAKTDSAHSGLAPVQIVAAPKGLLSAAEPQANGTMWVLAGDARSRGLFQLDPANGKVLGSRPVSNAAQSVAQTSSGLLGLALGTHRSGALELLDSHTADVQRTVPLPAPARQVVAGSDGTTLYVLTSWRSIASVTVLGSASGHISGAVPVPAGTVSIAPDVQQTSLYVLERNGVVSRVSISDGRVQTDFKIGHSGESLAISPDGTKLYALKDTNAAADVAVVNVATESVRRELPAPAGCRQVMISPGGRQLYDVVGTPSFGNVQVFTA